MHRALFLTDILRLVVEVADSQATLAALAATNRMWSELALNRLWYRLDGLYVLAKCMPDELWDEYENDPENPYDVNKERMIKMRIRELDDISILGSRFLSYAGRIRELFIGASPLMRLSKDTHVSTIVDSSVLDAWVRTSRHRPLFSQLRILHYDATQQAPLHQRLMLQLVHQSLHPALLHLSLIEDLSEVYKPLDPAWNDTVRYFSVACPNLEYFTFQVPDSSSAYHGPESDGGEPSEIRKLLVSNVASTACQLHTLRSVSLHIPLTPNSFVHLATLPHLTTLRCHIAQWSEGINFSTKAFDALQDLQCRVESLSTLTSFLQKISTARLESIKCMTWNVPSIELVSLFARCLANCHFRDVLDTLTVRTAMSRVLSAPSHAFPVVVEPLRGMRRLRRLVFRFLQCPITDNQFMWLWESLPALVSLEMARAPILGFMTLRSMSRRPCIYEGRLSIALRIDHELPSEPEMPLIPKLGTLGIGEVPESDLLALARTLIGLFPDVERLVPHTPTTYLSMDRFHNLQQFIWKLRSERRGNQSPNSRPIMNPHNYLAQPGRTLNTPRRSVLVTRRRVV